ncbi:MAG: beta-lactamase domain protein [Herbinix sp.]|jgi:hypothetical protein|nr:beta-lactamase domain protein [Herbinix sp.]
MGNKIVEGLSAITRSSHEIKPDILLLNFTIVNACLVGIPGDKTDQWVLVDAW